MSRESNGGGGSGGGLTLPVILGVVFIVLKLTNVITWSWWWVLAPFWGSLAQGVVILMVFGTVVAIVGSDRR